MARRKKNAGKSYNDLLSEYKKLAKRADQRMVRIEQAEGQKGYEHATSFAYSKAAAEIERFSGSLKEGQKARWNRATPKTKSALESKIAAINRFLGSETSTKSGIRQGYKNRAETLKKEYDINVPWQDLGKFFQSPAYQKLTATIAGSKTAVKMLGAFQRNRETILNAINEAQSQDLDLEGVDMELFGDKVKEFIKKNPKDVVAFLNEFK